jgi:hypothetical protein
MNNPNLPSRNHAIFSSCVAGAGNGGERWVVADGCEVTSLALSCAIEPPYVAIPVSAMLKPLAILRHNLLFRISEYSECRSFIR